MTFDLQVAINLALFAGVVIAALVYARSQVAKQAQDETQDLADTRGKTISDLRVEIADLQDSLRNMEARLNVLEAMQTDEIIEGVIPGVVAGLKPFLKGA